MSSVSFHTPVLPIQTEADFTAAVERAAALLRAGEVVALPTETVYGLAANALDPAAVAKIFAAKGRPAHNPIIVHVAGLAMARRCVADWLPGAALLSRAFWPGPLTLVLPKAQTIPDIVTAGGPTVGVRWPSHPFMQAVIQACGFPLAAPSANLSNQISPTTAAHVRRQLDGRLPLIVDGGACAVGIESTVVAVAASGFRTLRPGMIHEESLAAVLGAPEPAGKAAVTGAGPLMSPGQLPRHYAPKARLLVLEWAGDADLLEQAARLGLAVERTCVVAHTHLPGIGNWLDVSVIPHDPEAFARALYAELHRCDDRRAGWIVVERTPGHGPWRAITDRLKRAAADAGAQ